MIHMAQLPPLQYKWYRWPYNPTQYSITFDKDIAVHRYPFSNQADMEDLGENPDKVSGWGEFFGDGAYDEFKKLCNVKKSPGSGALIHPIWSIHNALFKNLQVTQEPRANYVKYTFEFVQETKDQEYVVEIGGANLYKPSPEFMINKTNRATYTVKQGECMWGIAKDMDMELDTLVSLNPAVKNPAVLFTGTKLFIE
jgi:hypothetical protein